jgi:hypothetical protein
MLFSDWHSHSALDYDQVTEPFDQKQKGSETRGDEIDFETLKPIGGAFWASVWACASPDSAQLSQRRFLLPVPAYLPPFPRSKARLSKRACQDQLIHGCSHDQTPALKLLRHAHMGLRP